MGHKSLSYYAYITKCHFGWPNISLQCSFLCQLCNPIRFDYSIKHNNNTWKQLTFSQRAFPLIVMEFIFSKNHLVKTIQFESSSKLT